MCLRVVLFAILTNGGLITAKTSDPLSQLKYYELIENPTNWSSLASGLRYLSFYALGKDFNLELWPIKASISSQFHISLSNGDAYNLQDLKLPEIYRGSLRGILTSSAFVQTDGSNLISASVNFPDGIVIVETLKFYERLCDSPKLLAYWFHDVITKNMSMQHAIYPDHNGGLHQFTSRLDRSPRSAVKPKSQLLCGIRFIADYSFFANIGGFDHAKTIDILVKTFNRVNEIFLSTDFSDESDNLTIKYGFYLKGISIESTDSGEHRGVSSAKDLLLAFSKRVFEEDVCLIHLFTFSPNIYGVLGMSWMASPSLQHMGGVCSHKGVSQSQMSLAPNTGFTSYSDSNGEQILSSLAELVTAHELGHSWGAPHDPATAACEPPAEKGGRYLMFNFAVPGYSPNNYRFSPCSRKAISRCLSAKAQFCFEEAALVDTHECGNSRVDPGEECDTGGDRSPNDPCCTVNCRLKPDAQCSPFNHRCCQPNCQLAPKDTLCAETSEFTPCLNSGVCDGKRADCPGPSPSLTSKSCHEYGHCVNGVCAPFCSRLQLPTCICNEAEASCLICCAFKVKLGNDLRTLCQPIVLLSPGNKSDDSNASVLLHSPDWQMFRLQDAGVPVNSTDYYFLATSKRFQSSPLKRIDKTEFNFSTMALENNRPCFFGLCKGGVCQRTNAKHVARLWPLFTYFSENTIATLMWDNLVGAIIVLTLCVWIPLSLLVSRNDAKLLKAHVMAMQGTEALKTPNTFSNRS